MLCEFAVDPEALTSFDRCTRILDGMGVRHGRMIAEFPDLRRWVELVRRACRAADVPDVTRMKIIERINSVRNRFVRSRRLYRNQLPWLVNAIEQDRIAPFHAIISPQNADGSSRILPADDLWDDAVLWNVPREKAVPRTAEALTECVAPIFQNSREILFVDYRFDPREAAWRDLLGAFVQTATSTRRVFRRCEYHLSLVRGNEFHLAGTCQQYLPGILPQGFELEALRWKRLDHGERLHARHILTDIGGVRIEKGLDIGRPGETTDVSLLDNDLWNQRWAELQPGTAAFTLLDRCTVVGQATLRV